MFATRTIDATTRRLGAMLITTFVIAIALTAVALNTIRLGGALDRENQRDSAFVADILPPALFLVEPMLQATWIASDPEEADEHIRAIGELEKVYHERLAYWKASDLAPALKQRVVANLEPIGNRFFSQFHAELEPAAATHDPVRINQAHDRLEGVYNQYKAEVDQLVILANHENEQVHASSLTLSNWSIVLLAAIGIALVSQLVWAMKTLQRRALVPLAETAQTMTRMAAGDLDAGRTDEHRPDEIGEMTRAIEVFRASARRQLDAAGEQQVVVEALSGALTRLADGQLDVAIEQRFEAEYEPLRDAFNGTVRRLGDLISEVTTAAGNVRVGAGEILSAADDLALRNERQAGSVEETAAAMRHVTTGVAESARNTAGVRDTISATHGDVVAGGQTVGRMVATMADVEQSSKEINQIISVIEGISFQTNLLALNAGVEAARAGEAGKGFAVVANEVRALAQRSSEAAREISALIQTSTLRVDEGVALVGQTGKLLDTIVERMGTINDSAAEIAHSADTQAMNLEQVNASVSEMDRVTQQNAAMVEQATAAARSLADEADRLGRLVARFSAKGAAVVDIAPRRAAPPVIPPSPRTVGAQALAMDEDWGEF